MFIERAPKVTSSIADNLKLLNGRTISIDIDAVTQATFILALNYASHELGKVILKKDLVSYWELANIAKANGISHDKALEYAKNAWNRNDVYLKSPVVPGIVTLLRIFNDLKIPYVFISSRPAEFLGVTHEWFTNTLPWVKKESIILGRKEGTSGGDFKAEMIGRHEVLLHFEDAPEEALIVASKTSAGVVVVPQPWNRQKMDHPRIKQIEPYRETGGVWEVIRFLASLEARNFLQNVAQY